MPGLATDFYFIFFLVLEFELRVLQLLGRHSTIWATFQLFLLWLFWKQCLSFWLRFSCFRLPALDGMTGIYHNTQFSSIEMGFSLTFFLPGLALNCDPSSLRFGMTGAHHCAQLWLSWGLTNCLPGLALNHDLLNLSLPSS
jgi:hypothetical protein